MIDRRNLHPRTHVRASIGWIVYRNIRVRAGQSYAHRVVTITGRVGCVRTYKRVDWEVDLRIVVPKDQDSVIVCKCLVERRGAC